MLKEKKERSYRQISCGTNSVKLYAAYKIIKGDIMDNIIELINDEGKLEKLVVEATFHIDDILYAVLHKINSDEGMVYYVEEMEDGSIVLVKVEDEEEIKEVQEIYEGIADDLI